MDNKITDLKIKIIDISEDLAQEIEIIKDLTHILATYSLNSIEENNYCITSLISILNEKIEKYSEDYSIFEDLLYKVNI